MTKEHQMNFFLLPLCFYFVLILDSHQVLGESSSFKRWELSLEGERRYQIHRENLRVKGHNFISPAISYSLYPQWALKLESFSRSESQQVGNISQNYELENWMFWVSKKIKSFTELSYSLLGGVGVYREFGNFNLLGQESSLQSHWKTMGGVGGSVKWQFHSILFLRFELRLLYGTDFSPNLNWSQRLSLGSSF